MKGLLRKAARYGYYRIPLPWRLGPKFRRCRALLARSQWWSSDRLEAHQGTQLRRLIEHAYASVSYYRDLLGRLGLTPSDFSSPSDLRLLPPLTKQEARENASRLLSRRIPPRDLFAVSTSGSSGIPFHLYWDRKTAIPVEEAFACTAYEWVGYRNGDLRAEFLWVGPEGRSAVYDPPSRMLRLPAKDLDPEMLRSHVDALRRYRPRALRSIPSNLVLLATFMLDNELPPLDSLQTVVYSSERALPWQRESIEKALGCRVSSLYGQTEHSILAAECEVGQRHHVFPEYGITELLDDEGQPITEPGVVGHLYGTGFHNPAMPLIRYATGDMSAWSAAPCSSGRSYPLLTDIEGRDSDYLVTPGGRLVPLITIPYSAIMVKVGHFQFHQQEPDSVTLRIVPLSDYGEEHGERMRRRLEEELPGVRVRIERVKQLQRAARGKIPYLIQEIPRASLAESAGDATELASGASEPRAPEPP